MEEIRKSNHKNYLPSYPFSTEEIIEKYPYLSPYIRQYMGADDLINGKKRYCRKCIYYRQCISESVSADYHGGYYH